MASTTRTMIMSLGVLLAGLPGIARAGDCAALASGTWPGTSIDRVEQVAADTVRPFGAGNLPTGMAADGERVAFLPAHCLVRGVIGRRPSTIPGNTLGIGFELRMPDDWNGRFFFQGGGGWDGWLRQASGVIVSATADRASALARGFAVVSTDAGHLSDQPSPATDGRFAADLRAREDNARDAVAQTTLVAKQIVTRYYAKPIDHSYFVGCSNGGREGMLDRQADRLRFGRSGTRRWFRAGRSCGRRCRHAAPGATRDLRRAKADQVPARGLIAAGDRTLLGTGRGWPGGSPWAGGCPTFRIGMDPAGIRAGQADGGVGAVTRPGGGRTCEHLMRLPPGRQHELGILLGWGGAPTPGIVTGCARSSPSRPPIAATRRRPARRSRTMQGSPCRLDVTMRHCGSVRARCPRRLRCYAALRTWTRLPGVIGSARSPVLAPIRGCLASPMTVNTVPPARGDLLRQGQVRALFTVATEQTSGTARQAAVGAGGQVMRRGDTVPRANPRTPAARPAPRRGSCSPIPASSTTPT